MDPLRLLFTGQRINCIRWQYTSHHSCVTPGKIQNKCVGLTFGRPRYFSIFQIDFFTFIGRLHVNSFEGPVSLVIRFIYFDILFVVAAFTVVILSHIFIFRRTNLFHLRSFQFCCFAFEFEFTFCLALYSTFHSSNLKKLETKIRVQI